MKQELFKVVKVTFSYAVFILPSDLGFLFFQTKNKHLYLTFYIYRKSEKYFI